VKPKTSCKLIVPGSVFCLRSLKPLSRLFSELFLLDKLDGWKRLLYLAGCSLDRTSIEDFCKTHHAMSPDVVLKLGHTSVEEMTRKCNLLLGLSARMALKSGLYRNHDMSIDYHDVIYSGRKNPYTVNVLKGDKMKRCLRYGVVGLTQRRSFLALGIQPYKPGVTNALMVTRLLEDLPTNPGLVLMDRFFSGVDVYNACEAQGHDFLTPYKLNDRTDEMYKESILDGITVRDYRVNSRTGGDRTVKMYFQYDPDNEYYAYVCNREDINIEGHYPYRWNIENCLKVKNMVDAVTSSTSMAYRLLLETVSLILANLWKLLVKTASIGTIKDFKRKLEHEILVETDMQDNIQRLDASNTS
jgi:hypothetical protein